MPRLTPNTAPPPDYYANNLLGVVQHVCSAHAELLGVSRPAIERIAQLSRGGVRLLARLIMRTTRVIRLDSLNYAEVPDLQTALAELVGSDLIVVDGVVAADALLGRLKVAEMKELFADLVAPKDRKSDLVNRILCSLTDASIRQRCRSQFSWVTLTTSDHLQRLRLSYFGDLYRDLTEFVMRDLGISEFEDYSLGDNARAFTDCAELEQYLELANLQRLPVARRHAALLWLWSQSSIANDALANPSLQRRRDKLLTSWGRDFERAEQPQLAHRCYERAGAHPARERRVRLYHKANDQTARDELLGAMREQPWSHEEALFASRFGKPAKRTSITAWPETTWAATAAQMPGVEQITANRLMANGGQAWHTENALLTSLLGLAFWDIIFAPEPGMFTHPFQSGPRDLFWADFRTRSLARQDAIEQRLVEFAEPEHLWNCIHRTVQNKAGRSCRLVHWGLVARDRCAILAAARSSFSAAQLTRVFDYMLRDLGQVRSGMPDLFVFYGTGHFELVEVKGPSDQLQPNQRVWLQALVDMDIPCRVIRHKLAAQAKPGRIRAKAREA